MTVAESQSRAYLSPPEETYWRWSEDGGAVTWNDVDGRTIAFRPQLEEALETLAPRGLPRIGAVLLLLAALRDDWGGSGLPGEVSLGATPRHAAAPLLGANGGNAGSSGPGRAILTRYIDRLVTEKLQMVGPPAGEDSIYAMLAERLRAVPLALDRVAGLPTATRSDPRLRAALTEAIFERAPERLGPGPARAALNLLSAVARPAELRPDFRIEDELKEFELDVQALRPGLEALDPRGLELRLRTGLETEPAAAALEVPASERVRDLVRRLLSDRELAGLSRLATKLMAAIHVPRRLRDEEDLPLGGYSDLTNRGPLDRLLTSELAHDDLTLAVRIALNEALYLRRESPPRSPPSRRFVFLDAGIRLWGVPRIFATAAGLALAATAGPETRVTVHRASGHVLTRVDLSAREGLMTHLESLEPAPHPGDALPAMLRAIEGESGAVDAILVTHRDALEDPELRAAFERPGDLELHVASVAADGSFQLDHVSKRGIRPICHAQLSLEEILAKPPASPAPLPLVVAGVPGDLPLLLGLEPFPLLLTTRELCPEGARPLPGRGVVGPAGDGRLLHWTGRDQGARQLTTLLPKGAVHGLFPEEGGRVLLVAGALAGNRIPMLVADLDAGTVGRLELQASGQLPRGAFRIPGAVCLVFRDRVDAFDPETGETLAALSLRPSTIAWSEGRFFRCGDAWASLCYDGHRLELAPAGARAAGALALFDRRGRDGPWLITREGLVVSTSDGTTLPLSLDFTHAFRVAGVSSDGDRICLRVSGRVQSHYLMDLTALRVAPVTGDPRIALEPDLGICSASNSRGPLLRSFRAVLVDDRGRLLLVTRSGECQCLDWLPGDWPELTSLGTLADGLSRAVPFETVPPHDSIRFGLRRASLRGGSVFLDARGLLHLRSDDGAAPELSLVLTSGRMSGWSSRNGVFGSRFFTSLEPETPWEEVRQQLVHFTRGVR